MMLDRVRQLLFRYRSYTPLPFLLPAVLFARPEAGGLFAGLLCVVSGEAIRLRSVAVAGPDTRATLGPTAHALVTAGPYAWTRNPIYTGNMLIYLGVGLMSMALFPWLQAAAVGWFAFQYGLIVQYEERYLEQRFGDAYRAYRGSVNRFVPRFASDPAGAYGGVRGGIASDRRTLQAEVAVILVLVAIYFARSGTG